MSSRHRVQPFIPRITTLALSGDVREAAALCRRSRPSRLGPDERSHRERFLRRFVAGEDDPPNGDGPAAGIVGVYQGYWRRVLRGGGAPPAERKLRRDLTAVLRRHRCRTDGDLAPRATALLARHGYHAQIGRTRPHMDLLVWRRQTETTYEVELPDGERRVPVVLMRGFVTLGWQEYATLGIAFPGGWATRRKLFCVVESYDTSSEKFRVSYLGHEAQHFADYGAFPRLESADLEYRAKLTELCLARATLRPLLEAFTRGAAPNPASPHALAAYCLIRDLAAELGCAVRQFPDTAARRLRLAARRLLDHHSARLRAVDAGRVLGVISA